MFGCGSMGYVKNFNKSGNAMPWHCIGLTLSYSF